MNVVRAVSEEGFGRVAFNTKILQQLNSDNKFRDYFEQESKELPEYYKNLVKKELGPLWEWLPEDALYHDAKAYLKTEGQKIAV